MQGSTVGMLCIATIVVIGAGIGIVYIGNPGSGEQDVCHYAIYTASGSSGDGIVTGFLKVEETDVTDTSYVQVYSYDLHLILENGQDLVLLKDVFREERSYGDDKGVSEERETIDTVFGKADTIVYRTLENGRLSVNYVGEGGKLTYRMVQDDGNYRITYDLKETNLPNQ